MKIKTRIYCFLPNSVLFRTRSCCVSHICILQGIRLLSWLLLCRQHAKRWLRKQ